MSRCFLQFNPSNEEVEKKLDFNQKQRQEQKLSDTDTNRLVTSLLVTYPKIDSGKFNYIVRSKLDGSMAHSKSIKR